MPDFTIEKLTNILRSFSQTQCDFFSENCIAALEANNLQPGCLLRVTGKAEKEFRLLWSKQFSRAGYKEQKKITEKAAEAISFFLSSELTEYCVIEEAVIGTSIDYWLGYETTHPLYDPRNFIQARMEISEINRETPGNTVEARVRAKRDRIDQTNSSSLEAYISIVELFTPKAFFAKK
jgi:hypothetical protein